MIHTTFDIRHAQSSGCYVVESLNHPTYFHFVDADLVDACWENNRLNSVTICTLERGATLDTQFLKWLSLAGDCGN